MATTRKGVAISLIISYELDKKLNDYAEARAIPRAQAIRELLETSFRISTAWEVTRRQVVRDGV